METSQRSEGEKNVTLLEELRKDLSVKEEELQNLVQEKDLLEERNKELEDQVDGLGIKVKELLNRKTEIYEVPENYTGIENQWIELLEFKQKISEGQKTIQAQNEKITEMQASLKSHAQIIVSLKLEKDNAVKYSGKLRELLQEARDEIDYKNKTIYKIHEKLVFKQNECEKLRSDLKDMQLGSEYYGRRTSSRGGGRCDMCSGSVGSSAGRTGGDFYDGSSKVGKNMSNYMSESLIGMSVKKVDNIRAKIDNLKKLRLPSVGHHRKRVFSKVNCSFSNHSCQHHHPNNPGNNQAKAYNTLRKQLEIRGRLYEFLQKRADETCDDFYDLLKTTLSCSGKGGELKPSNVANNKGVDGNEGAEYTASNINITRSFRTVAQYDQAYPEMYDEIDEIFVESDE